VLKSLRLLHASKSLLPDADIKQIFLQDHRDKFFNRELSCQIDLVDRLRFVLAGSFANVGIMVGTLVAEEVKGLDDFEKKTLANTVFLSEITAEYANHRDITQALREFQMEGTICPIFWLDDDGNELGGYPAGFEVTFSNRRNFQDVVVKDPIIKTVTNQVHLLCQLSHMNTQKEIIIRDEDYRYGQDEFVIGGVERMRALTWRLQQPFNIFHGANTMVLPQNDYSHMSYMSDFDLDNEGRRYACVASVMGRQCANRVRASGITLLPSELFARVTTDLVFCPRNRAMKLRLHPSKTHAKSFSRVIARFEGSNSTGSEGGDDDDDEYEEHKKILEDEFQFGPGSGLTVQDMANINWARKAVSAKRIYLVSVTMSSMMVHCFKKDCALC
jgi:hypothetical protein